MKWIGQHIWDFTSRFRNDVYLETLTENFDEFTVVIGNDNKLYKSTTPSEKSKIQVRNDEGSTIPAGAPLYSKGEIGGSDRIKVGICVSSDPAKMPCIGVAEFEMNTTSTKDSFAITQGVYNTNIHGFTGLSEGDILYVNGGVAPHLTPTKPTNGDLIQNVGIVLKTNGTICQGLLVSAIGRTNDVPWPLYVDHTTQRVGIGTSSPTVPFHVIGDARIQGNLTVNGTYTQIDTDVLTTEQWLVTNDGTGPAAVINQLGSQDIFDVQDDGTSVFYIEDGGNVGVGTTNPSGKLDVNGVVRVGNGGAWATSAGAVQLTYDTSTAQGVLSTYYDTTSLRLGAGISQKTGITINGQSNANGNNITFRVGNSDRVHIDSSGNVGIGTTSPTHKLEVRGGDVHFENASSSNTFLDVKGSSANGYIRAYSDSNSVWLYQGGSNSYLQAQSGSTLRLGSGTANVVITDTSGEVMRTSSGNVGIGTTSPAYKLDVAGAAQIQAATSAYLTFEQSSNQYQAAINSSNHLVLQAAFNNQVIFKDGGATNMVIDGTTSNVGIGTTSPGEKLEVNGNVKLNSVGHELQFANHNVGGYRDGNHRLILAGYGGIDFVSENVGGMENQAKRVRITPSGSVGIGTTSPSARLEVSSDSSYSSDLNILSVSGTKTGGTAVTNVKGINVDIGSNDHVVGYDITNLYGAYINNNASGGSATVINNWYGVYVPAADADRVSNSVSAYFGDNVGIGTSSPNYALDVKKDDASILHLYRPNSSTAASTNLDFSFNTADASQALYARITADVETNTNSAQGGDLSFHTANAGTISEVMRLTEDGNVGIGTTSPQADLQVGSVTTSFYSLSTGKADFIDTDKVLSETQMGTLNVTSNSRSVGDNSDLGPSITFSQNVSQYVDGYEKVIGGIKSYITTSGNTGENSSLGFYTHSGSSLSEKVTINSSGNVGIGTTSPGEKLTLKASSASEAILGAQYSTTTTNFFEVGVSSHDSYLTLKNSGTTEVVKINSDGDSYLNGGNVGIGTTSPSTKLEVISTANEDGIALKNTSGNLKYKVRHWEQNTYSSFWNASNQETVRIAAGGSSFFNGGNVGIGQTDPQTLLHLTTTMSSSPTTQLYLDVDGSNTNGGGGEIIFNTSASAGTPALYNAKITGTRASGGTGGDSQLGFWTTLVSSSTSPQERMTITKEGNVGIGTTSPSSKLHVAGEITTEDQINFKNVNGSLLKITKDSWTTVPTHDLIYQGWDTTIDDYIYLKAPGNTTTTHGIALIGDNVIAFGRTNNETGAPELTSAAAPLNDNWLVLNSTSATFSGRADFQKDLRLRGTDAAANQGVVRFYVDSSNKLFIDTVNDGSNLFAIDSSGNVGIGTTSPSEKLEVNGNVQASSYKISGVTVLSGSANVSLGSSGATGTISLNTHTSTALYVAGDDNVGIGTTTPSEKLEVNGKIKATDINFSGLPTSSVGLSSGDVWNDGGTLKIVS